MLKVDRYVNRNTTEDEIVLDNTSTDESDYSEEVLDEVIDDLKAEYGDSRRYRLSVKECAICGRKQGEDVPGCKHRYWYRKNHLCPDCYKEYCNGLKWADWPEWVKMLVSESKKLLEAEAHEGLIEDMPELAERGYISEETGWVEEYRFGFEDPDIEPGNSPHASTIERNLCEKETEKEETEALRLAVSKLDSFDREIVRLTYEEGMTQDKVARALDVTRNTISLHLKSTQEKLKDRLTNI